MDFDVDKFKELILYVAEKSADDPSFGATKLNKILFFSDFLAYGMLGRPITGATYQRQDQGPVARGMLPAQKTLEREGAATVVQRVYFTRPQKRLINLRPADISSFTAEEIALVDRVIEALGHRNASEVSMLSHQHVLAWQLAGDRQEIPYEAVFLSTDPPTPTDIRRGQELAQEHGW